MKTLEYKPQGVCAKKITVSVDDNNVITDVSFENGCDGNHKGLVALCRGMSVREAHDRLSGITCGFRNTSCPDQLAKALEKFL